MIWYDILLTLAFALITWQAHTISKLYKAMNDLADVQIDLFESVKKLAKMNVSNSAAINHNADLSDNINRVIAQKVHDLDNELNHRGDD